MAINEFRGKYFFLSNFYEAEVTYRGLTYQNSEAAFQSMKCSKPEQKIKFCNMSPSEAKAKGRKVRLSHTWENIKDAVMYEVVKAKFEQHEYLKQWLLATGDEPLEEGNQHGDDVWGTVNGIGENRLGKILMRVREELRGI